MTTDRKIPATQIKVQPQQLLDLAWRTIALQFVLVSGRLKYASVIGDCSTGVCVVLCADNHALTREDQCGRWSGGRCVTVGITWARRARGRRARRAVCGSVH